MVVVQALKDILSIKIKTRHDGYSDQFNRMLMPKVLLICSVIIAVDYFSDKVNCMVTNDSKLSSDFIHSACWINGFYIYKEMRGKLSESGYYGIPEWAGTDGMDKAGQLCSIQDLFGSNKYCTPMTRIYYLQYQWMPFYLGAISLLYYLPYIVFRMVNTDLISLKNALKAFAGDSDMLVRNYFNYKVNSPYQLRLRIWWNAFVKVLYVFASLTAFYLTDYLLNGKYLSYGKDYLVWAMKNVTLQHTTIKLRVDPKPGNILLPSMGLCDIHESAQDTRNRYANVNRFICEISPNILYQYILMVLWFFFVISILISALGLFFYPSNHIYKVLYFWKGAPKKSIHRYITLRETEYLDYIKKKNMVVYGEIVRKLKQQRPDLQGKIFEGFETNNTYEENHAPPLYHNGQYFTKKEWQMNTFGRKSQTEEYQSYC